MVDYLQISLLSVSFNLCPLFPNNIVSSLLNGQSLQFLYKWPFNQGYVRRLQKTRMTIVPNDVFLTRIQKLEETRPKSLLLLLYLNPFKTRK